MYVQISRYKKACINSWHIELKYPKSTLVSCLRSTSSRSLPGNSHHSQAGRDLGRCAMLPGGGGEKGEGTRWHCGISSIINNSTKKSSKRCTVVQSFLSSVHWQYAKKFPCLMTNEDSSLPTPTTKLLKPWRQLEPNIPNAMRSRTGRPSLKIMAPFFLGEVTVED